MSGIIGKNTHYGINDLAIVCSKDKWYIIFNGCALSEGVITIEYVMKLLTKKFKKVKNFIVRIEGKESSLEFQGLFSRNDIELFLNNREGFDCFKLI